MCYYDDTQEGCAYHACVVNPTGVDADGYYCPANPCFHDDTIEGCPNWACNIDWFGEDPHSYNGFCPGNECYMDTTMPNCPDFVDPCVLYPQGYDHYGMYCPDHVCNTADSTNQPECPDYVFVEDPACVNGWDQTIWSDYSTYEMVCLGIYPTVDCSMSENTYHPDCYTSIDCTLTWNLHLPECGGTVDPIVEPPVDVCEASNYTDPGCSCIIDPTGYDCFCFHTPWEEYWNPTDGSHSFCPDHMCSYDDTVIGCPYHACTMNPMGVDADGFYCPGNPCYHDDTIEGCPNWSCNFDFAGYDHHDINGYCPGNICYNDNTIYGCPGHILLPFCEQDPYGLDEQGDFCPQHVCLDPM